MPSRLIHLLSLFALFAASFSMVVEPVLSALVDSPDHLCVDSDTEGDDDQENDELLLTEEAYLDDTFTLECRITLLSNVTTSSRNLDGDPRGPPAVPSTQVALAIRPQTA
jgi:hypothetical protein